MRTCIDFPEEDIDRLREQFEINNEDDLFAAICECIETYLEAMKK